MTADGRLVLDPDRVPEEAVTRFLVSGDARTNAEKLADKWKLEDKARRLAQRAQQRANNKRK